MPPELVIFTSTFQNMQPLSKTKLELYSSLVTPKLRRRKGLFMVEGVKCVADCLGSFELEAIVLEQGAYCDRFIEVGSDKLRYATPSQMRHLSTMSTASKVVALFRIPDSNPSDENADTDTEPLEKDKWYLLLDGVRDPGNLGSIIRTADWFGFHRIFLSDDCADVYNPKTLQATMGSIAHVKVSVTDLEKLIGKYPGMPVAGTLLDGMDIYDAELPSGGFIVMGNEGKGLSERIRGKVTMPLTIPPYGPVHGESLNVAAATAVVLSRIRHFK